MMLFLRVFSLAALLTIYSGCSSSGTSEEGDELFEDEEDVAAAADTDYVPGEDMEFFDSDGTSETEDVASGDPLPEPAPATPPPASDYSFNSPGLSETTPIANGNSVEYTVQAGDTLMKIAFDHYGDLYRWKDIYSSNSSKITNPNQISKGMVLKIEGATQNSAPQGSGEKYAIQKGDTLGTISSRVYGTPSKWRSLWDNNKELIKDPNRIYAGFNLYYSPSGDFSPKNETSPLGNTDLNQPMEAPDSAAPPVTSFQDSDQGSRDPSSEVKKNESKPKAAPASANPEELWEEDEKENKNLFE